MWVKPFFDQVPNKGFALLAAGQFADCKNLGSGVPSLMAADKSCPLLQPSLVHLGDFYFSGILEHVCAFSNYFAKLVSDFLSFDLA